MQTHRALALALVLATLQSATTSAGATEAWARVPASQKAAAATRSITTVADYGNWIWAHGDADILKAIGAIGIADTAATFTLDLGGERFDPAQRFPVAATDFARDAGPSLRLVQFEGPLQTQWLTQLRARGIEPVQYIPPFTYVVWARGSDLLQAAGSPGVRWVGAFAERWRRGLSLRNPANGLLDVRAMLYRPAAITDAELQLAGGAAVTERARVDALFDSVSLHLDAAAIARVLAVPGVYAVHEVPRNGGLRGEVGDAISAAQFNGSGVPLPGYRAWLNGLGYDGTGVIIGAVDGGIFDTHPDLVHRMLPCTGSTCGGSATNAHGTHTAATMAGDGSAGVLANGYNRGLGVAPGANLIEQKYSPTYTQAGGMLKLMRESYQNNAVLSGNSWGPSDTPLGYDADTRQVDVGIRDTDPDTAGDQPLTFVLSIMNGNGGTSTQGTPDEAKNIITVGSTWAENGAGVPRTTLGNVSSNSAHGPALDGRRIPHLVAPGCNIDSASSATGYTTMCGTSMASPHVSGTVALFTQYYRTRYGHNPSTAVAKAALLASVQDLAGGTDANGGLLGHRPDNKQGWGRLRIDRLLSNAAANWYFDQAHVFENTGESWSQGIYAIDPTQPVTIMLVFTDAPGHGLGGSTPAWNNDLDLSVTSAGHTYLGNVFGADGYATAGGAPDAKNNAEGVVLRSDQLAPAIQIVVSATAINSKALPNAASLLNQDFAIVCTNCAATPLVDEIYADGFDSDGS